MYRITLRLHGRKKDRQVLVDADRSSNAERKVELEASEYVYDICLANCTYAEIRSLGSPSSNR